MKREYIEVPVKRAGHSAGLNLPRYMTEGASGMDLHAAVEEQVKIMPGAVELVPTGLQAAVPPGYELQIRPRSGLAAKSRIGLLNSPGTIDSDYRGEIKIILINLGQEPFIIEHGARIAQMVLCPVVKMTLTEVDELPSTERSEGGFGHTGL